VNKIREVKEVREVEVEEEMSTIVDTIFVVRGFNRDICELVFLDFSPVDS
jgi:hypothetical protein